MKTVTTPLLEIAYEEIGPSDGKPILLLHGWPFDALTWNAVMPALAQSGYRAFAPMLRGFGETRFLDTHTYRTGQLTAIAQDAIDFADALGIARFTLVGHDWGGQAAYQMAVNWPERLEKMVVLSVAYSSDPTRSLPLAQRHAYWYQWFFQTQQARFALEQDRRAFCHYLWQTWMPTWTLNEAEFDAAAASWDNPDWVEVTLTSYRHRWGNALSDSRYASLEAKRLQQPSISVPTWVLHGDEDGASLVGSTEGQEHFFTAAYKRQVLPGIGHFPQREQPQAVVDAVLAGN